MKKIEFSKLLLYADYVILMLLVFLNTVCDKDLETVIVAWIAQIGISSAAYYWKAKCENRTKVPMNVIETLPEDIREQVNLTEIISAIIQAE